MSLPLPEYPNLQALFQQAQLGISPSETHGLISGLYCGGMKLDDQQVQTVLADLVNEGAALPAMITDVISELRGQIADTLLDSDMSFTPLLPDDEQPLSVQAEALVEWVQGFLVGFGINQKDLKNADEDVKEVIQDFAEISKLDTEFSDSDEDAAAFYEVLEYVRMSALFCFEELSDAPAAPAAETKPTLH